MKKNLITNTLMVGSDHAGYALKQKLIERLHEAYPDLMVLNEGTNSEESCDYPDFAVKVAKKVSAIEGYGMLICGSGVGMSIAANKIKGIRAGLVWNAEVAKLTREHNNANILCLGSRQIDEETAWECLQVWLTTNFDTTGRHGRRLDKIKEIES